jgi:hypothetical protein
MMSGKSPRCCKRAFANVDQLRGRHATPIGLQPFNSCRLDQPLDIDGDVNLARPKVGFTQIDRLWAAFGAAGSSARLSFT